MQIDHGFNTTITPGSNSTSHNQHENMYNHDGKMDDDRDWCTNSLAVELSSVESAAVAGMMGMLREPNSISYDTIRNDPGGSMLNRSAIDLNPLSLNHESVHSRGATSGGSVEDSDECSITSYCSVSSSVLMNGRMRNRASSGATAPPSSPTATEDRRGPDSAHFATPAAPQFKPTPATRSYTGNTTTSNSSNNSHTSMHFRNGSEGRSRLQNDSFGAYCNPSPPLSISIPTDRTFGYWVPWNYTQSREHDPFGVREQASYTADDTEMHTSPHPHHHAVLEHRAENYRVEENDDEKEDTGSIASDQSLAVEVESVDEEGTYLSYGGHSEDFEPIVVGYSSADLHTNYPHNQQSRQHYHPHHQQQRSQTEYTVEDPDTPQSYTYGRSVASSAGTPQDRGSFYSTENLPSVELPPSPQHLRRPQHRKAYLPRVDRLDQEHQEHQQGDSEASERSDTRDHSASPSSIYERDLLEYQRLHGEGCRYRSTTPNNLHNSNCTAESSEARGGRSINASTYFHNHYPHSEPHILHETQFAQSTHTSNNNNNNNHNNNHNNNDNNNTTVHKHGPDRLRRRTLKRPPAHHASTHSFSSTLSSNNSSLYNTDISIAGAVGTGKRKRSSNSLDEQSPHHAPGKKTHKECDGAGYSSRVNNGSTHNGSSDSTVNVNMRHMYLDSPSIDPH